jgi:DNA-binding CsgD family transcriptional regulator
MIVKWLWLDRQPKTQAEIARRLGISGQRCVNIDKP